MSHARSAMPLLDRGPTHWKCSRKRSSLRRCALAATIMRSNFGVSGCKHFNARGARPRLRPALSCLGMLIACTESQPEAARAARVCEASAAQVLTELARGSSDGTQAAQHGLQALAQLQPCEEAQELAAANAALAKARIEHQQLRGRIAELEATRRRQASALHFAQAHAQALRQAARQAPPNAPMDAGKEVARQAAEADAELQPPRRVTHLSGQAPDRRSGRAHKGNALRGQP